MGQVERLIEKVKDSGVPVFIRGESGTGKELVAKTIHERSRRCAGRFVAVNCGSIPENLLESELFGYVRGAFTGAFKDKPGLIEEADGGTFFLDEIGDLYPHLQVKLLRLLQEKEVRRLGEIRSRKVDVRFISATHRDIEKEVRRGSFREDLYYRLKILTIEICPLRKRREDIFPLVQHFLGLYQENGQEERAVFSSQAMMQLMEYGWPGNVRELQNEIQRCLVLCGEKRVIHPELLSPKIWQQREAREESEYDFFSAKAEFEKTFVRQALLQFNYSRARTAKEIGLSRQGLFKLMKRHNITAPRPLKRGCETGSGRKKG